MQEKELKHCQEKTRYNLIKSRIYQEVCSSTGSEEPRGRAARGSLLIFLEGSTEALLSDFSPRFYQEQGEGILCLLLSRLGVGRYEKSSAGS